MPGSPNATRTCWIAGVVLVAVGVVVKRVFAPTFATPTSEAWCAIAGIAIVSVGLGVIAFGISRRRLWKLARQASVSEKKPLPQLPLS